jgi:hypothetical protein
MDNLSLIQKRMGLAIAHRQGKPADLKAFDSKGIDIYSRLIRIGRLDLMRSIYPIIARLIGDGFDDLALDYFESVKTGHYNYNRAAENFGRYLCEKRDDLMEVHPFIAELADYEWIELAVVEADVEDFEGSGAAVTDEDLVGAQAQAERFATLVPVLNRAMVCREYRYNIPAIALAIKKSKAGKPPKTKTKLAKELVPVIVYRDPEDYCPRFLEVGEVSLDLARTLFDGDNQINYGQLLTTLCTRPGLSPEAAASLLPGCVEAIEQFKSFGLIVAEL